MGACLVAGGFYLGFLCRLHLVCRAAKFIKLVGKSWERATGLLRNHNFWIIPRR